MKCREVQSYFEDNAPDKADSVEAAEHVSGCANCRRMLDMRQETSTRLHLLRESAPAFPASLDSSVLANYRKQIATRQRPEAASPWWRVEFAGWRLGVAVAAMLLILATVFGFHKPPVKTTIGQPTTGPPEIARLPEHAPSVSVRPGRIRKNSVVAQRTQPRRPEAAPAREVSAAVSSARLEYSVPDGFRSLMYCDELSCDGGMEVVRVQLPSSAAGFMPVPTAGNRVVTADVLVGADGFARGIRIVH
jgi:hypothetical protein